MESSEIDRQSSPGPGDQIVINHRLWRAIAKGALRSPRGPLWVALVHADRHVWQDVVPRRRLALAVGTQFAPLSLFIASLVAVALGVSHSQTAAASSGGKKAAAASDSMSFVIEPGNTEIERGSSLL